MKKKRLGINIDHVATLRNARGEFYPNPLKAALIAQECGADSITIHLREDRRHIRDSDLKNINKKIKIPLNLEISPTLEMLKIAISNKPDYVCLVPEKRQEITTEGGLNVHKNIKSLFKAITILKKANIRVSLFIEPKISDINLSKLLRADCVELHTGRYCKVFENKKKRSFEFKRIKMAAHHAQNIGLDVHAGHGLTYDSTRLLSKIRYISEFNIGHFIISESVFVGLKKSINKFKKIINN